ncbi:hypothetical protein B7P43_G09183 [Cryptotermes secundus]|uniref:Odorant receptor n=1 Tax=Cryptotermes secundus TaxID=105785 RepID=A0A2J7QGW0_9NEOP|nr:hypothetical protein B7P43_G09183 [Cryptotermes secundus]
MAKEKETGLFNSKEQEHPRRLKMLDLQLKAFNLSGILPPASISGSRWKTILYDIFTVISLIWFLPAIAAQLVALYQHLEDIEVLTAILFQVSCYISTGVIFFYFVWNRKELLKLFDTLEAGFIGHMDKVGSPIKRTVILTEAARKSRVITWILLCLCFTVETAWGCIPFILGYVEYFTDAEPRDLTNDKGRYFGLAMWLPDNVNKSPTYELMHAFHFIAVYTVVSNITGCYMLMFAFAFHTTTQFKILCAAFEDVDDFIQKSQDSEDKTANGCHREWNSRKKVRDDLKSLYVDRSTEEDIRGSVNTDTSHEGNCRGHVSGSFGQSDSAISHQRDKPFDLRYSKEFIKLKHVKLEEDISNNETPETSTTLQPCDKILQQYLIDCIQFHQELIMFSTEMNKFLSPVVLVFFVFSEAMMCLSTFQLALGQADERSFKFFTSVILACIWPLMVCMYGDDLMEQSTAVKHAAFGCQWYNRSADFSTLLRFVIMRAQKPVQLTAGSFYVVSLATFADETAMNESFTNAETKNTLRHHSVDDEVFGPLLPEDITISEPQRIRHEGGISSRTEFRGAFASERHVNHNGSNGNPFMSNLSEETATSHSLRNEKMHRYLIECIKYHQALLEFCDEVNKFLSPVLLVFFLGSEAMVCFSAFQLALGLSDGNFKFFTSVVDTIAWPLMICWYGEYLSEQVGNKVYAFFTVLKHMLES